MIALTVVILVLVLFAILIAYATYMMGFYWDRTKERDPLRLDTNEYAPYNDLMIDQVGKILQEPYEEVYITSNDGLRLFGKYYERKAGAPVELMVHGYHAVAERDFPFYLKYAFEREHNVLLIDQRSHGNSEGHTVCFGVKEREDVLLWCRYLVERLGEDVKILLEGVSMGSATVMMSTALPLPENVKGVVADCGYTSPEDIIKLVIPAMVPVPVNAIYPFVKLGAVLFGHFSITSASAIEAMKTIKQPILFIHGENDTFVPFYMVKELYDACNSPLKCKYTVKNAPHARSTFEDYVGCADELGKFMDKLGI
ncbi:MAG: alpha/beta hydrolase [Lachnospiraceae bacterium]|nr:alpha/beta hydrolase [Lachnospiraceae bacterium]